MRLKIDLILASTVTPDPNSAFDWLLFRAALGANKAAALDIVAAARGFSMGVAADPMIAAGKQSIAGDWRRILIVMSTIRIAPRVWFRDGQGQRFSVRRSDRGILLRKFVRRPIRITAIRARRRHEGVYTARDDCSRRSFFKMKATRFSKVACVRWLNFARCPDQAGLQTDDW